MGAEVKEEVVIGLEAEVRMKVYNDCKFFFLLFGLDFLVSLFWLKNIKVLPKPLIIKLGKEEEANSENKHQIVIQKARSLV